MDISKEDKGRIEEALVKRISKDSPGCFYTFQGIRVITMQQAYDVAEAEHLHLLPQIEALKAKIHEEKMRYNSSIERNIDKREVIERQSSLLERMAGLIQRLANHFPGGEIEEVTALLKEYNESKP